MKLQESLPAAIEPERVELPPVSKHKLTEENLKKNDQLSSKAASKKSKKASKPAWALT